LLSFHAYESASGSSRRGGEPTAAAQANEQWHLSKIIILRILSLTYPWGPGLAEATAALVRRAVHARSTLRCVRER